MEIRLSELAARLDARIVGDDDRLIRGVSTLKDAVDSDVSFLANKGYKHQLVATRAGAVIVAERDLEDCPVTALVVDNPYLAFARVTQIFDNRPVAQVGVHATAVVGEGTVLDDGVSVAANAVIGRNCRIGAGTEIGAGTFIGDNCVLGSDCQINANVTLYHNVVMGDRVRVHSASVIGGDGFGFAPDKGRWERIAQLGGVLIGNDVSIGSNTCIDRGALGDTVIEDNVILDNLIQIAHNVCIGEGSAIAGCTGIAGSTVVGKHCTLAGGVGLAGHLTIADNVHITGMSLISNSIPEPGVYSSGTSFMPANEWRRNATRFKQLDSMAKRLTKLEKSQEGKS